MRLIDADALRQTMESNLYWGLDSDGAIMDTIDEAPTVDAVEVVHGRWEPHPNANGFERCSVCHDCIIYDDWATEPKWYYCPNCGAKMDGGKDRDR
jgi:hypothetical protein